MWQSWSSTRANGNLFRGNLPPSEWHKNFEGQAIFSLAEELMRQHLLPYTWLPRTYSQANWNKLERFLRSSGHLLCSFLSHNYLLYLRLLYFIAVPIGWSQTLFPSTLLSHVGHSPCGIYCGAACKCFWNVTCSIGRRASSGRNFHIWKIAAWNSVEHNRCGQEGHWECCYTNTSHTCICKHSGKPSNAIPCKICQRAAWLPCLI